MKRHEIIRIILIVLLFMTAIPAIIIFGLHHFGERKYYFISFLIILCAMLPFFWSFERRAPKARELVLIAVLIGIGVAGRVAFYMIPQFKAVVAIIIITGIALGAETGFLAGALTAFASNMFFGQGPWTPWQMFSMGLIGFLAGLLFQNGILPKRRSIICIFGVFATLVIYGGIMNPASVLMFQSEISWGALITSYAAGIWFDLIHAAATGLFLFFLAKPMLKKLDRVNLKYGITDPE